jgi:FdhE protein
MPDYALLAAEWEELLARRAAFREPLRFWTTVLQGWLRWREATPAPLSWSAEQCRERWDRGVALLAESAPVIRRAAVEDMLGPLMEALASHGRHAAEGLQRFALAWDRGEIGPESLLPRPGRDPVAALGQQLGLGSELAAFLGPGALRPALETYFEAVRALPDGLWMRGICPWCGGFPSYGDLIEDGRRRLSCPLCGGAWIAPRLRCPFCEAWNSRDLVRLVAEGSEEGYFVEACRACRGYVKGVDRRERWNAGSPLLEDWGSPHLDLYARQEGYWRPTPSLVHLLAQDDD